MAPPPPATAAAGLVMLELEGGIEALLMLKLVELSGFFPELKEREGERLIKGNNATDKEHHRSYYETC